MKIKEYMKDHIVILDGSTGTMLATKGLDFLAESTESWNLKHPEIVKELHKSYFDAGSNVVTSNTFGVNAKKYPDENEMERLIMAAFDNAMQAREESCGSQEKFVGYNIGPTGKMLEPYGDLEFAEAVGIFAKGVRLGVKAGAELIMIETMMDVEEAKAAVVACKENCDLPVFVSHTYAENGHIMMGASPAEVVKAMEAAGADVVGVNCSFGPGRLKSIVQEYLDTASVPVSFKPNAGLPKKTASGSVYDISPKEFAQSVGEMIHMGVRLVGGCCGTTPEFIRELAALR